MNAVLYCMYSTDLIDVSCGFVFGAIANCKYRNVNTIVPRTRMLKHGELILARLLSSLAGAVVSIVSYYKYYTIVSAKIYLQTIPCM